MIDFTDQMNPLNIIVGNLYRLKRTCLDIVESCDDFITNRRREKNIKHFSSLKCKKEMYKTFQYTLKAITMLTLTKGRRISYRDIRLLSFEIRKCITGEEVPDKSDFYHKIASAPKHVKKFERIFSKDEFCVVRERRTKGGNTYFVDIDKCFLKEK